MRKLITTFLAAGLLFSSTSAIVACGGPGPGDEVKFNTKNAVAKQNVNTQDPQRDYVYNDQYKYNENLLRTGLAPMMQLAADKLRINKDDFINDSDIARNFYNSNVYKSNHYDSINYNNASDETKQLTRPFTFKDKNGVFIPYALTDNDKSKEQFYLYWFVIAKDSESAETIKGNDITSLEIPKISDFTKDGKEVSKVNKNGWIHLFLQMQDPNRNVTYQIDFNIEINITFKLHVDSKNQVTILFDQDSVSKPLGDVDFDHPERSFDRLNNMTFSEIKNQ